MCFSEIEPRTRTREAFRLCSSMTDADLDPGDVEFVEPYTYDEEQPFLVLAGTDVDILCFPCEEDFTVGFCKRVLAHVHPDRLALGSCELVATNRVRSDAETLVDIFDGVHEPRYGPNRNLQIAVWPKTGTPRAAPTSPSTSRTSPTAPRCTPSFAANGGSTRPGGWTRRVRACLDEGAPRRRAARRYRRR